MTPQPNLVVVVTLQENSGKLVNYVVQPGKLEDFVRYALNLQGWAKTTIVSIVEETTTAA
jgi:hypothetical protein